MRLCFQLQSLCTSPAAHDFHHQHSILIAKNFRRLSPRLRAAFLFAACGLKLSGETRKKLGKSAHITATELIDDMTTSAVERLATLTDEEIQAVTEASSDDKGQIRSRVDARLGVLTKKDLIQQAQAGREWSKRGDTGLQLGLRSVIEEEVNNRVNTLSMMLPEQFGNANSFSWDRLWRVPWLVAEHPYRQTCLTCPTFTPAPIR